MPGIFVTLEGIEASGKTTLAFALERRLRDAGIDPVVTREPGGTPLGDRLRAVFLDDRAHLQPTTELFVICAARAEHVAQVIVPALEAGRTVLCDRFSDATRAYQGGGRGLDDATILTCCNYATGGLNPQLTFLLDVPPEMSAARLAARLKAANASHDRIEREGLEFHARVRERYLAIARAEPERVKVLDAAADADLLLAEAWGVLSERLSAV
jgi:dTMP kinase